jgi:CheY-like chemotaxis protein/HPt (histidine-containing phosphotransfer) domain-containing protein
MHNRILIVDDVEINQELAKMIVVSKGFEVDIASNGEEAVDAVSRNEYDLVFMDIHMPVMDGIEATKTIRSLPDKEKSSIAIVALTANVGLSQADYKDIGFNESLSKPVSDKIITEVIKRYTSWTGESKRDAKVGKNVAPLYDLSMIESISGGDQQFIKQMVKLFLDNMPQNIEILKRSVEDEDWEQMWKTAHKMKSTIDSLNIVELKQEIRTIELSGKKLEGFELIPAIVQKVEKVLNDCMEDLQKKYDENHFG